MHALPNFFHNRVSQIAFINDEQTLFSPYTVPMPRSWVCTTEGFPRNRYQRHKSNGTEAGNWTWALLCWSPHLSDLHNSFTATCPLLPPSAGNNFTLPRLRSSSSQASITRSSIATMLQLRAEAIPNLRAQHSQLPSQPGPSRIQEGKDHPMKGDRAFPPQALWAWGHSEEISPLQSSAKQVLEQARESMVTVSSRRGQEAQTAALWDFWWYKCYF